MDCHKHAALKWVLGIQMSILTCTAKPSPQPPRALLLSSHLLTRALSPHPAHALKRQTATMTNSVNTSILRHSFVKFLLFYSIALSSVDTKVSVSMCESENR